MEPKEKAKELIKEYYLIVSNIASHWDEESRKQIFIPIAKDCSLSLVNEIIQGAFVSIKLHEIEYWNKVKKELKNYYLCK